MRLHMFVAGALAAGLVGAAQAEEPAQDYSAALSRMLTATAAGTCPEDVMGPGLLAACRQQVEAMAAGLSSLGAVETLTFIRAEDGTYGRVEFYTVTFAGGHSMVWAIGGLSDGKFEVAYSNG